MDPRIPQLADVLIDHSVGLKRGEKILIEGYDVPDEILIALIRKVRQKGGIPILDTSRQRLRREMFMGATQAQLDFIVEHELARMKDMDAYVALRGSDNIFEYSDIPDKKMQLIQTALKPVLDQRVEHTRWVVLRWPTPAMAQQAMTSTEAFEEFFFKVCTLNYGRMKPGMNALKKLMEKTDQVEIKGPGTDLRFSIKGIGAVACGGTHNIPDGEVFSCPVRDSVEGEVTFNAPSLYQGTSFDKVHFEFEKGQIIKATANGNQRKLKQILDSDEGARYIGEFAIGFNPHITEPMRDILFDEKIAGSFHFTPGRAYEETNNGNDSRIHWDLVSIQRKDYGGGEIYFDGKLIRKDGLFVPKSLEKLNPDYLLAED